MSDLEPLEADSTSQGLTGQIFRKEQFTEVCTGVREPTEDGAAPGAPAQGVFHCR